MSYISPAARFLYVSAIGAFMLAAAAVSRDGINAWPWILAAVAVALAASVADDVATESDFIEDALEEIRAGLISDHEAARRDPQRSPPLRSR